MHFLSKIQNLTVSIIDIGGIERAHLCTKLLMLFLDILYFVIPVSISLGRKMRLSASSQISITAKSIFGHFEVIFLKIYVFLGVGFLFPVSKFEQKQFKEELSSLAGFNMKFIFKQK